MPQLVTLVNTGRSRHLKVRLAGLANNGGSENNGITKAYGLYTVLSASECVTLGVSQLSFPSAIMEKLYQKNW